MDEKKTSDKTHPLYAAMLQLAKAALALTLSLCSLLALRTPSQYGSGTRRRGARDAGGVGGEGGGGAAVGGGGGGSNGARVRGTDGVEGVVGGGGGGSEGVVVRRTDGVAGYMQQITPERIWNPRRSMKM